VWTVEPLASHHARDGFASGASGLDDWIKTKASQWQRKDLARVYVATDAGAGGESTRACGYYSLSNHYVEYEALTREGARGVSRMHVPAVLLGRLAVDRCSKGDGLGSQLLFDAMKRAVRVADGTGIRVFEVRALDERARAFYLHHGLELLEDDPDHLFVSMDALRKL